MKINHEACPQAPISMQEEQSEHCAPLLLVIQALSLVQLSATPWTAAC